MTTLYLARHGQSEWNNQGRVTGQLDPGLSATGHEQSEGLARCLQGEALDAIYCSALRRTAATAAPTAAASGLPVVPLAALNEIHAGDLQGRFRDERDAEAHALWARWRADLWGPGLPGGERFDEFALRVGAALQTILHRHEGQRVLVVGHSATNRVVLGTLLGWPRERWSELRPRNLHARRQQDRPLRAGLHYLTRKRARTLRVICCAAELRREERSAGTLKSSSPHAHWIEPVANTRAPLPAL
jgi:broad specificity phosphatase PhoE